MNERIKELAEQAGLQPYYKDQERQIERFAELIRQDERDKCAQDYLQDCADAVEEARLEEREACVKIALRYEPIERSRWVKYAADEMRQRGDSK